MAGALTCIIVDDNYLDRLSVELELKNVRELTLLGSFETALEAMETIKNQKPDILFLDVDMPDINGLQLFKSIDNYAPLCVIISSYAEYAIEGFDLKVFDYILKPVHSERFNLSIKRLLEFNSIKAKAGAYSTQIENERIVFKEGYHEVYLSIADIIYLEAFGDYTKVVTQKKNYLTLATLSAFLEDLPCDKFTRIHRSYAVAKSHVNLITNNSIAIGTVTLPIGKTYRASISQFKS